MRYTNNSGFWRWHKWRGHNPWLSSYWPPIEDYNTKPANRVGPLRVCVCVLQEEGSSSSSSPSSCCPTWQVLIMTWQVNSQLETEIHSTWHRNRLRVFLALKKEWRDRQDIIYFLGSIMFVMLYFSSQNAPLVPGRWNWMQPCSRGPHLWPALTSQVKGLRDRGAYCETKIHREGGIAQQLLLFNQQKNL